MLVLILLPCAESFGVRARILLLTGSLALVSSVALTLRIQGGKLADCKIKIYNLKITMPY